MVRLGPEPEGWDGGLTENDMVCVDAESVVDPDCRTSTFTLYVPAPTRLIQVHDGLEEYCRTTLLPRVYRYSTLPVAPAATVVKVTEEPATCGDAGVAVSDVIVIEEGALTVYDADCVAAESVADPTCRTSIFTV